MYTKKTKSINKLSLSAIIAFILVLVMFLGIFLGKFLRNVKEYGFWEAIRMITKAKKNVE